MITALKNLIRDDQGATLVEYALIVALIAVVALVAVRTLGTNASSTLNNAASSL